MRFVDEAKVVVHAGNGGKGCVSFLRTKSNPRGGPDGGAGGKGGDVVFVGGSQLGTLLDFRYRRILKAKHGRGGSGKQKNGANADPLMLEVPIGTVIIDAESNIELAELMEEKQTFTVCLGGTGGRGNSSFVTSINRAPREHEGGEEGEVKELILRLKLIADLGLLGQPNVGKSTLLKSITNSNTKVANYSFTTLWPNLGVLDFGAHEPNLTLTDLPGLIKGAGSEGRGLGSRFLGHAERCKALAICLAADDTNIADSIAMLIEEVNAFDESILQKPLFLVLTKCDLLDESLHEQALSDVLATLSQHDINPLAAHLLSAKTNWQLAEFVMKLCDWNRQIKNVPEQINTQNKEWSPLTQS